MISGANDKELELATARADILLMCGSETIKIIDKEIDRLTVESTEWESKCYKYQDIIDELEKEFEWQLKKQIDIDKFAEEQGFLNYNPVKLMVERFKNKLNSLKEGK